MVTVVNQCLGASPATHRDHDNLLPQPYGKEGLRNGAIIVVLVDHDDFVSFACFFIGITKYVM